MTGFAPGMSAYTKITVLGDSLALPRPADGILIDDIYPTLLARRPYTVVFNRSKASAETVHFLESEPLYYGIKYANSQIFVIHVGICDCSPRLFTKREKNILNIVSAIPRMARFANLYISTYSKNRMYHTRKRQIQNVDLKSYEDNLEKIISVIRSDNPVEKIFLINIAIPGPHLADRSYGVADIINSYNASIQAVASRHPELVSVVDVHGFTRQNPSVVIEDGHHINAVGHQFIYDTIAANL